MGIKWLFEEFAFAMEKIRAVRRWASASFARTLTLLSLVAIALLAPFAYLQILQSAATSNIETRNQELMIIGKEHSYRAALEAVNMCMDSEKEKARLRDWYCKAAILRYEQVSIGWPQDRVKEVVGKSAYGAMRNDISNYLRSIEVDRILKAPPSPEEKFLKLVISKTVLALWISITVFLLAGLFMALRVLPPRDLGGPGA